MSLIGVVLISRNKDNRNVQGFRERREAFLTTRDSERIAERFDSFVSRALPGETCRLYETVNARNPELTRQQLLVELISKPDTNLTALESMACSVAMRRENAAEHRWLLDFDSLDENLLQRCVQFIPPTIDYTLSRTPHGFAIVCSHGFDTRTIVSEIPCVTVKRDGMLLVDWRKKE